ncbi:MAG: ABC transporter permease [Pseudaminobacter sp.]
MTTPVATGRQQYGASRLWGLPWLTIVIICGFVFAGLLAPWISPYDPNAQDLMLRLRPPSAAHWLGTDGLGRDVLTRLIYGARVSLVVVLCALAVGLLIGLTLGVIAGYFGGKIDAVISRAIDAALSIPSLFLGLLLAVTLGAGLGSVVIAISLILWSRFARIIRGEVIALKHRDFILQARITGCSPLRIVLVHILPNILNTVLVLVSINLGEVILLEASLSFLGAGIPPPAASWGGLVADGQNYLTSAWWLALAPGMAILLTVLAFNIFGDWCRDMLDPRLRDRL